MRTRRMGCSNMVTAFGDANTYCVGQEANSKDATTTQCGGCAGCNKRHPAILESKTRASGGAVAYEFEE